MATRGVFAAIIKMTEDPKPIPAILLLQRKGNPDGSGYPEQYELPGGRTQEGESDVDCLNRRIFEETGIEIQVLRQASENLSVSPGIVTVHQSDDSCAYLCRLSGGAFREFPTDAHKEARWVITTELFDGTIKVGCPNPTSKGYVSRMMKMILAGFHIHQMQS